MTLYTDDFTRLDAANLGPNWRRSLNMGILANKAASTNTNAVAEWAQPVTQNHRSTITHLRNSGTGGFNGPAVRMSPSTTSCYAIRGDTYSSGNLILRKHSTDSLSTNITTILGGGVSYENKDITLEAIDNVINVYINTILVYSYTDPSPLVGDRCGFRSDTSLKWADNWRGESIEATVSKVWLNTGSGTKKNVVRKARV